jgi:6-phosphogluconolactonase
VHPSGRWAVVSERGDDSMHMFSIDGKTGALTFVHRFSAGGGGPRFFDFAPDGNWIIVAHQKDGTLGSMRFDVDTGRLSDSAHRLKVSAPACVVFDVAGSNVR